MLAFAASVLIIRSNPGGIVDSTASDGRDMFCSATDGDIRYVVRTLAGDATDDERAAARSSVRMYFSDGFVDGAPADLRTIAQRLVDDLGRLRDGGSVDDAVVASIVDDFVVLRDARGPVCGD